MARLILVFPIIVWLSLVGQNVANDALCMGVEYNRFVRDPTSCARYFLCRNNRAIPGTCENGLHFDLDMQMCRYPSVVNCDPNEITTQPPPVTPEGPIENWVCIGRAHNSFCADPRRCGSFFLCLNQIGRPGNCPHRHWFHPIFYFCTNPGGFCTPRERCDNGIDENGRNCEETSTIAPTESTTTETTTVTTTETTTTTEIDTTTPPGPIELWVCIGIRDNAFRNHPHRCGAYFLCRQFVGILGECPRRTWFHPQLHFCTNPTGFCVPRDRCDNGIDQNGQTCEDDRETTTTETTTVTTTETTTTTEIDTTTPAGPIELWVCIGVRDNAFRNHPHRCGAYFLCRQFVGILGECPRRTWFHPQLHFCTNPTGFCVPRDRCDNGIDHNGQNCEEDRETTTTEVTTPSTTTVAPITTTPAGPIELWVCIGIPHNRFTRHPRRCGAFFLCVNQIGFPGECPRRFWFHPTLHVCTSPGGFCHTEETCDNGVGNCPNSSEETKEKSNESKDCNSSNSSSDSNESRCNSNETGEVEATTPSGPVEDWVCKGIANLRVTAHPERCGTFFLCMFEIGLPVECPNRLWFNPSDHICMEPGDFCTPTTPCDNGVGNGCTGVTTEDPIITPTHSTSTVAF